MRWGCNLRAWSYTLSVQGVLGVQSASTVVSALHARSAVVREYASTVVSALSARSAVGHKYASTVVYAIGARSVVGQEYASTAVYALSARNVAPRRMGGDSCFVRVVYIRAPSSSPRSSPSSAWPARSHPPQPRLHPSHRRSTSRTPSSTPWSSGPRPTRASPAPPPGS